MTGIFLTLIGAKTVVPPQPVNVSINVTGLSASASIKAVTVSVPEVAGSQLFSTVGTSIFVVPENVTSISAVCVGGGGGGGRCGTSAARPFGFAGGSGAGGGLVWANNIPVTPGETLTIQVGAGGSGGTVLEANAGNGEQSLIIKDSVGSVVIRADGGQGGRGSTSVDALGGTGFVNTDLVSGTSGVNSGGLGYRARSNFGGYGGGGAAGFEGSGGNAVTGAAGTANSGAAGAGAFTGDAALYAGGGGGVGVINGKGATGAASSDSNKAGQAGSGGQNGGNALAGLTLPNGGNGGAYGGGAGSADDDVDLNPGFIGGQGAVYIVWPGNTRAFPSSL